MNRVYFHPVAAETLSSWEYSTCIRCSDSMADRAYNYTNNDNVCRAPCERGRTRCPSCRDRQKHICAVSVISDFPGRAALACILEQEYQRAIKRSAQDPHHLRVGHLPFRRL